MKGDRRLEDRLSLSVGTGSNNLSSIDLRSPGAASRLCHNCRQLPAPFLHYFWVVIGGCVFQVPPVVFVSALRAPGPPYHPETENLLSAQSPKKPPSHPFIINRNLSIPLLLLALSTRYPFPAFCLLHTTSPLFASSTLSPSLIIVCLSFEYLPSSRRPLFLVSTSFISNRAWVDPRLSILCLLIPLKLIEPALPLPTAPDDRLVPFHRAQDRYYDKWNHIIGLKFSF